MSLAKVSVEDRLDAYDMLARYCLLIDEGDCEGWLDLWEEDGLFFGTRREPVWGHEGLRSAPEMNLAAGMRHFMINLTCEYGETHDDLIVRGYNLVIGWLAEPKLVANAVVRYHLIRRADTWKIKSNVVRLQVGPDYPTDRLPPGFPIPNNQATRFPSL